MPNLSNLLDGSSIIDLRSPARQADVFQALAERLSIRSGVSISDIIAAFEARAQEATIGVGDGVALAHARLPGVERAIGAFARLSSPLDVDAHDERRCDLVFALLTSSDADAVHLKALAQISRTFVDSELRAALRRGEENVAELLLGRQRGAAA